MSPPSPTVRRRPPNFSRRCLGRGGVVGGLAGPVRELEAKLLDVTSVTDRASKAAELLPPMLGAGGKRTYLVLFQNTAEIRATGGIPGSVATLTADKGALSLKSEGTASVLGTYD